MAQEIKKKPAGKRNIIPDNLPGNGTDPEKKKNRFSIYWVYGIILLAIITYNLMRTVSTAGIEINQVYLTEILRGGDVADDIKADKEKTGIVVVRNKDIARL